MRDRWDEEIGGAELTINLLTESFAAREGQLVPAEETVEAFQTPADALHDLPARADWVR